MFRDIRYPRKSARSEKSVFCTNVKLTSVSVLEENIIIVLFYLYHLESVSDPFPETHGFMDMWIYFMSDRK
jgi:hypothetical protein